MHTLPSPITERHLNQRVRKTHNLAQLSHPSLYLWINKTIIGPLERGMQSLFDSVLLFSLSLILAHLLLLSQSPTLMLPHTHTVLSYFSALLALFSFSNIAEIINSPVSPFVECLQRLRHPNSTRIEKLHWIWPHDLRALRRKAPPRGYPQPT